LASNLHGSAGAPGWVESPAVQRLPQHLLLRAWSDFARSEDLEQSTIDQYAYWLLRLNAETLVDLHDVTLDHLAPFLATKTGPSRSQAKRAFRSFYRWMRGTRRMEENPTELLPRYRRRRRVPDVLSWDELTRLVIAAAWHRPEWAWGLLFVFATGARVGEACRVRRTDVSLDRQTVTLRDTKNGEDRVVPLGPLGLQAVLELSDGRETLLGITPGAFRRRMKVLAIQTGIPQRKAHPHVLRHTCGTQLEERGASQRQIMEHLGHKDPTMTALYSHITGKRGRKTAALLDGSPPS
jgi:integrase